MYFRLVMTCAFTVFSAATLVAQDRDTKVRQDRSTFSSSDFWIYNDLDQAVEEARLLNKPLLVVFRCIPCEACHEFDEQVARRDPLVRDAMNQFVCARIIQANGLDLTQFQFDFDQSFAIVMMHHDGTILGRYGTRSNRNDESEDISLEGLKKALEGAAELHQNYARIKNSLTGKQVQHAQYKRPEQFPHLSGKYGSQLDYEGKVASSCIHCHQVGEAQRLVYRAAGKPIPDEVLFPHPNPKVLGLTMDPKEMATVKDVEPGSSGAEDGFRPGDRLIKLAGQPLLSTADIQWILHHAPAQGSLPVELEREGQPLTLSLTLRPGWRRGDISWRATTWDLRRMALGGLVLEDLSDQERDALGIEPDQLALRVKHVGQFGQHAVAKRAGFRKEDVITAFGPLTQRAPERELIAYAVQQLKPGENVRVSLLRGGKPLALRLTLQ